jgi:hypothetical protein
MYHDMRYSNRAAFALSYFTTLSKVAHLNDIMAGWNLS